MIRRRSYWSITFLISLSLLSRSQESATIPVKGGALFYRSYGSGDPLLFIGGFAGLSSDYLEPLAQELGKRYRCYLIDQRATGKSDVVFMDTTTVNNKSVSEDAETLRKHLKIDRWVVAGHAWGGSVAITYAALFPTSTRALLLIGPSGIDLRFFDYYNTNAMKRLTAEDSAYYRTSIDHALSDRNRSLYIRFHATLPAYFHDRSKLSAIQPYVNERTYRPTVANTYWSAFINWNPPYATIFAKNRMPVVIIQGTEDPVDKRTADRIAQTIRGTKIKMIRLSGAFPWLEQPNSFWTKVDAFQRSLRNDQTPQKKK